ncbi:MAG: outer membrane beta-barrel protein [Flavobacteriales bacterium]|nr:outer membrane beta-barrel protein [Flavobacteriales bacterium]
MKKAFLPLAIAALLALPSTAQESKGFKLGIKAAPNLGWIKSTTKELEGDGVNLGFSFGLMTDFRLGSDNYALSTGLYMNLLGANQTSKSYKTAIGGLERTVPAFEFARRYQYVELPIMIQVEDQRDGLHDLLRSIGLRIRLLCIGQE